MIQDLIESKNYLTEKKLGRILNTICPGEEFIHNRSVPESGIRNRPDYRCDNLKLIVEFDGHFHFTDPVTILADEKKDITYSNMGYTIVRIPYFIQLDEFSVELFFDNIKEPYSHGEYFPHGFIASNAVLPAQYCSLGEEKFDYYWDKFFSSGLLGEFIAERNVWLQINFYGRDPRIVFPKKFIENNRELIDGVIEFGYPT